VTIEAFLFIFAAAGALSTAVMVVLARSPLRGALYLIASLCSVALLYVLLEAGFVAAMQVLVYAGAIMVLFVFVIMLLNLGPATARPAYLSLSKITGATAVGYLSYRVGDAALAVGSGAGKPIDGTVKAIGTLLLTDYLFGFEAISLLLLVAVVGAVVLGLKRLA
jgi:NADH-quinone oxidoreductase subunit J